MTTATRPQRGDTDHVRAALAVDIHAAWRGRSACAGLDMNPEPGSPEESKALAICATCPVLPDCSQWVMPLNEYTDPGGVCGGMTERGRARWRHTTAIKAGMAATAKPKKEDAMTTTSLETRPPMSIVPEPAPDLGIELKQPAALLALVARTLGMLSGFEDPAVAKQVGRASSALVQLEEALTIGERRRQAEADIETAKAALVAAQEKLRLLKTGKAPAVKTPDRTVGEPTPREIRAWAAEHGIECAPNGKIPASVRQQYDAAH